MIANGEGELRKIDSMIDRIQSVYSSELINKPVSGVIKVSDIIANYIGRYQIYPNEKTVELLVETVEDCLQDTLYEFVLQKVEAIVQNIEDVD